MPGAIFKNLFCIANVSHALSRFFKLSLYLICLSLLLVSIYKHGPGVSFFCNFATLFLDCTGLAYCHKYNNQSSKYSEQLQRTMYNKNYKKVTYHLGYADCVSLVIQTEDLDQSTGLNVDRH